MKAKTTISSFFRFGFFVYHKSVSALLNTDFERKEFCELKFFFNCFRLFFILIGTLEYFLYHKRHESKVIVCHLYEIITLLATANDNAFNRQTRKVGITIDDFHYLIESKIVFVFNLSHRPSFGVSSPAFITQRDASLAHKRLIILWLEFLEINLYVVGIRFPHR